MESFSSTSALLSTYRAMNHAELCPGRYLACRRRRDYPYSVLIQEMCQLNTWQYTCLCSAYSLVQVPYVSRLRNSVFGTAVRTGYSAPVHPNVRLSISLDP